MNEMKFHIGDAVYLDQPFGWGVVVHYEGTIIEINDDNALVEFKEGDRKWFFLWELTLTDPKRAVDV